MLIVENAQRFWNGQILNNKSGHTGSPATATATANQQPSPVWVVVVVVVVVAGYILSISFRFDILVRFFFT